MRRSVYKKGFVFSVIILLIGTALSNIAFGFEDPYNVKKDIKKNDDDEPPYVKILIPESGFLYFFLFGRTIKIPIPFPIVIIICHFKIRYYVIVKVNATDNIGVESVTFYIDDIMRYVDYESPYIWLWEEQTMMLLVYDLKVLARDYAGNEAYDIIRVWRTKRFLPPHF